MPGRSRNEERSIGAAVLGAGPAGLTAAYVLARPRYNNQDHSMWTAILAAPNLVDGTDTDVWSVNTDAEYLEEGEIVDEFVDVQLAG